MNTRCLLFRSMGVLSALLPAATSADESMPPGYTTTRTGVVHEFYGEDRDDGRPVKVRFTWDKIDADHARWEQAFSYDDRTWEANWTADFTRADAARTCEAGRPKR